MLYSEMQKEAKEEADKNSKKNKQKGSSGNKKLSSIVQDKE